MKFKIQPVKELVLVFNENKFSFKSKKEALDWMEAYRIKTERKLEEKKRQREIIEQDIKMYEKDLKAHKLQTEELNEFDCGDL